MNSEYERERALVSNGKLTVPLFHGTSTLFYQSILETGLGARSIVEDLKLRSINQSMVELCNTKLRPDDPEWLLDRHAALKIMTMPTNERPNIQSGFNFRYGGTYVTPSQFTATKYARLNSYGSEALSCTVKLFSRLSERFPEVEDRDDFAEIKELAHKPRDPLLVKASDVEVASLCAEQGGPNAPILDLIQTALADPDIYDDLVQQANFELLEPIQTCQLVFYKLVFSGHSLRDVKLVPL